MTGSKGNDSTMRMGTTQLTGQREKGKGHDCRREEPKVAHAVGDPLGLPGVGRVCSERRGESLER